MTDHPTPPTVPPGTVPVTPDKLSAGDKIWHPYYREPVTVTAVDLDSLDERGGVFVDAAHVYWYGLDGAAAGKSGIIKHADGDPPFHRLLDLAGTERTVPDDDATADQAPSA